MEKVNSDVMFRPGQVTLQPEGMKVLERSSGHHERI